jgi:hypothetical protein
VSKKLRMILPLNLDILFSNDHRGLLEGIGSPPEHMLSWVLYQWSLLQTQDSAELYDQLYVELESHATSTFEEEEDGRVRSMVAYIEEHMDQFAEAANGAYHRLLPFVGDLPNEKRVYGVTYDPFNKQAMVLTFEMEEVA